MSDSGYSFIVIDPKSLSKDDCNWSDKQIESCYEAFEILERNGYSPKWIKEDIAMREVRRRRCYFVFGKFQGTCFDYLASLKIPIYGTPVIIAYKDAKSTQNVLPYPCTPLYSIHFLKKSLTFTGLNLEENEMYTKLFKYMGGDPSNDLMESTDILICNNCDRSSSKYVEMARMKRFICQPKLITETYEKALNMEIFSASNNEYLHKYAVPLFSGMVFCVSGIRPSSRHDIQNIVEKNGGKYTGHMQNGETTHLLCEEASGRKYKKALEWNIVIVKLSWLADSVSSGYLLPYEKYSLTNKIRTCSTPNNSKVPNITIGDENLSSINNEGLKINLEKLDKRLTIFKDKHTPKAGNKSIRRKTSIVLGNATEPCAEDPANERTIDDIVDKYINEETSRQATGLSHDKKQSHGATFAVGDSTSQIFQGKTFRSLDSQKDNFKNKVEKSGGTYVDDTTTIVDYIYFPVNIDSMKIFTNSNCKNKVSDIWLISCLEKKSLLDPLKSPFYVPFYINLDSCHELLKDLIFYVYGFDKFETEAVCECILASGGKIVNDSDISSCFVTHVITCKPVNNLLEKTAFSTSKVVNYIWLTESISNCSLQKEEDFVFNNESRDIMRKDVCWLTWHHENEGSKENDDYNDMFEIFQGRMSIINKTMSLETPLRKMSSLGLNNSVSRSRQDQATSKLTKNIQKNLDIESEDVPDRFSKISTPSALLSGEKMKWKWGSEDLNTTKEAGETELTESFVTNVIDQHLLTMEDDFLNDSSVTRGPTDFSNLVKELEKPNDSTTPKGVSPVAKKRKLSIVLKTAHSSNLTRLVSRRKAAKSTFLKSPFKPGAIQPVEDNSESPLTDPTNVEFAWKDATQRCPSRTQVDSVKESFGRIVENDGTFDDDSNTIFFPLLDENDS